MAIWSMGAFVEGGHGEKKGDVFKKFTKTAGKFAVLWYNTDKDAAASKTHTALRGERS